MNNFLPSFTMNNIVFFFNREDLNIDLLKKIQKSYDAPIYEADLWDWNEKQDFDMIKVECQSLYDYYSKLSQLLENKHYIVESNEILDLEDVKNAFVPMEVKEELKKVVDVLREYLSKIRGYESSFNENNY